MCDYDSATIGAFIAGSMAGILLTGLFCSFIFDRKRGKK
jgi:hypothetical protein